MANELTLYFDKLKNKKKEKVSAGRIILFSFLSVITLGTILLFLPISCKTPISFFQALFSSTSFTCVTGLHVVEMTNFTRFGQWVIIGLMQVGGIGFMTLSFFIVTIVLGNIGFLGRSIASEILNFDSYGKIKHFIFLIIQMTLLIEIVGGVALYSQLSKIYPPEEAAFQATFYSISAFCNAVLSLRNDSVVPFANKPIILFILACLIVLGGIGFFVFYELFENLKAKLFRSTQCRKFRRLSLHTRLVLNATFYLTIFGMLAIFALERYGAFYSMGWTESLGQSLFYSISLRSAGFFTFNINHLRNASLLLTMTYMFIGASAGSTGGGIKTSTFVVFFATLISIAKGKSFVEIKGRTIPPTQVYKVISVVTMAMMWILVSTFILMLVEPEQSFLHLLFEATSALATTGLSCGITAGLSFLGKTVILLSMLAGRMGSLTFIYAIRQKHEKQPYKYPEEKVVIG